jgi:hypothetical protein
MTNADATDHFRMATMLCSPKLGARRRLTLSSAEMGPVVYSNAAHDMPVGERQEPGRLSTNDELVSGCW